MLPHNHLKFVFSEKATKFEKNLCRTFDKSVVFCVRNSVLVKKSTKIFKNKCIVQTLLCISDFEHTKPKVTLSSVQGVYCTKQDMYKF